MKILGLDISSSTIGWAILDGSGKLLKYGHIKPLKKAKADKQGKGYVARLADAYAHVYALVKNECPDAIVIEDYSRKFSHGKSTANTIIVLATFNEACALACYHASDIEPVKYPVTTMRKHVGNKFDNKMPKKDDVFPFIEKQYKDFEITKTRFGNIKSEHYDEADAIFTALAHIIISQENLQPS